MDAGNSRRETLRRFRETKVPAGIWAVRHLPSGRVLMGASANLAGALNRHRFELQTGRHRNQALQQDWLRDGADRFAFETVDVLKRADDATTDPAEELAELLELWQAEYLRLDIPVYDRR